MPLTPKTHVKAEKILTTGSGVRKPARLVFLSDQLATIASPALGKGGGTLAKHRTSLESTTYNIHLSVHILPKNKHAAIPNSKAMKLGHQGRSGSSELQDPMGNIFLQGPRFVHVSVLLTQGVVCCIQ